MTIREITVESKNQGESEKSLVKRILRRVNATLERLLTPVIIEKKEDDSSSVESAKETTPEVKKAPFVLQEWLGKHLEGPIVEQKGDEPQDPEAHHYKVESGNAFIHFELVNGRIYLSTHGDKYTHFPNKISEKTRARFEKTFRWSRLFPKYLEQVQAVSGKMAMDFQTDYVEKWVNRAGVNPIYSRALPRASALFLAASEVQGSVSASDVAEYFTGTLIDNALGGRSKRTWQVAAAVCVLGGMSMDDAQRTFGLDKTLDILRWEKEGSKGERPKVDVEVPETVRVISLLERNPDKKVSAWYNVTSSLVGRLLIAGYYQQRTAELQTHAGGQYLSENEAAKRTLAEIIVMMMMRLVPEDEAMIIIETMPSEDLYRIAENIAQDYRAEATVAEDEEEE